MKKRKKKTKKNPLFNIDKSIYDYWVYTGTSNPSKIWYSTTSNPNTWGGNQPDTYNWITRKIKWRDIKRAVATAKVALRDLWTITRDFLLIRSRSFYDLTPSITLSTSSTSGSTVKLLPSSYVITRKGKKKKS